MDTNSYPIGSHSTYIGALYKSGIFGFIPFVAMLYYVFKSIRETRLGITKNLITILYVFMLVLFTTMDMDATEWFLIYFFAFLGIFSSSNSITSKDRLGKSSVVCIESLVSY